MGKVLVTGGAGYIGSILVPELLKSKFHVTVIDNFMFNQTPLLDVSYSENLSILNQDVNDSRTLPEILKKHDIIIPLAAIVGAPACSRNEILTKSTNVDQVKTIVKHTSKDQRILFPVTNSGYGIGEKNKYCDELSPLRPVSLYGKSKVEAEKILLDDGKSIAFRLATVFGSAPRMRMDLLVNDFVYRALIDKVIVLFESHFKRNYIHIRDIASVFLHGISKFDDLKGNTFNVGLSDANLSKRELCEKIQVHIPEFQFIESDLLTDPDKRDYIVSNEKIEKTGWVPKFSIDDGILELIRTYSWLKTNNFSNV